MTAEMGLTAKDSRMPEATVCNDGGLVKTLRGRVLEPRWELIRGLVGVKEVPVLGTRTHACVGAGRSAGRFEGVIVNLQRICPDCHKCQAKTRLTTSFYCLIFDD